ncbi:MAG: FkbM family methyltransferase [Ginsengibacter sp.]
MKSTKKAAHDFARIFGLEFQRTPSSLGNSLAEYHIQKEAYEKKDNSIYFKELEVQVPTAIATPLLERYQCALQLKKRAGFSFSVNQDGELIAKNDAVQFIINDDEELFILSEVFLEGVYNLITPTSKPIALIDIGMNVGITSLFYASRENVEKVISFEPFNPTFSMAQKNMGLNPTISSKIKANNFGLAAQDSEIRVEYSPKEKGRMGINGLPRSEGYIAGKISSELMQLKSAGEEIAKLKQGLENNFVVCKMDTEGAEYQIIDSLFNSSLIFFADVYFIEWHEIKPVDIVARLKVSNFNIIETTSGFFHSGMIYAIKNESR